MITFEGFRLTTKPKIETPIIEYDGYVPDESWSQTLSNGKIATWKNGKVLNLNEKVIIVGVDEYGDKIERNVLVDPISEEIVNPGYKKGKIYYKGITSYGYAHFVCEKIVGDGINIQKFDHEQDNMLYKGVNVIQLDLKNKIGICQFDWIKEFK